MCFCVGHVALTVTGGEWLVACGSLTEVGSWAMHGFDTDPIRNPTIWSVEDGNQVNWFAHSGRILYQSMYFNRFVFILKTYLHWCDRTRVFICRRSLGRAIKANAGILGRWRYNANTFVHVTSQYRRSCERRWRQLRNELSTFVFIGSNRLKS